ncbi:MAG: hypothetical protein AAF847_06900 [Bacteroidota bacterium]
MANYHGNDKKNPKSYHLYEILDLLENEVFKYGISGDPIDKDGLSKRLREQLDLFNIVANWYRFEGHILVKDIAGNETARLLEDAFIDAHEKVYGYKPRGNRK